MTEDALRVNGTTKVGGAEDAEVGYISFELAIIVVICSFLCHRMTKNFSFCAVMKGAAWSWYRVWEERDRT